MDRPTPDVVGGSSIPREKIGTFASLRIRNFRFLLVGTTLANAAMWIQQVTLSWLVYDLVPRSHTPNGVALVQTGWSLMRSVGPGIGDRAGLEPVTP